MTNNTTTQSESESGAGETDAAVALHAEGIEKTYGSRFSFTRTVEVLTGASIELSAGEVAGIVGENGSGKSTLMKILVGILEPDDGSVTTDATVGWCPQDSLLYDRLTVEETFDLFGEAYGLDRNEIEQTRNRLANRLDFEQFMDYRIDHLSGGNRRKVDLSIALLHDPDVLLLDEPYTGFDWETYLTFWELTDDLTENGTAIAVISHLINEREYFDHIYELRDGKLHQDESGQNESQQGDQ